LWVIFFQAEDGIRDKLVTGVQTCALPILVLGCVTSHGSVMYFQKGGVRHRVASRISRSVTDMAPAILLATSSEFLIDNTWGVSEIGRASCRERVEKSVVGRVGEDEGVLCQ